MKAVTRRRYGDSAVLRVEQLPDPEPGEGQVLVRVGAAGVNMAEWHLMTGEPRLVRLALGMRRPRRATLGEDVAGVVEAVGAGVTSVVVGDRVFGSAVGAWAERCVARAELLRPIPDGVGVEEAGSAPMSGYTALAALAHVGDLERKHVAVTGAGGGVGSFLVQLAAARGARVTAVCSAAKEGFVRRLGAHEVVDYATSDPTAGPPRFDAVLDFAGGLPVRRWKRVIRPGGVLVMGGAENGGRVLGPLRRSLSVLFVPGLRAVTLVASATPGLLTELADALDSGEVRSPVARTYPLDQVAQAVDDLHAARHPGKLVLIP